jgi:hypothetical protein
MRQMMPSTSSACLDRRGHSFDSRESLENCAAPPLNLGIGADNLLHTDSTKPRVRCSVTNPTNKDALYTLSSTFSGTHFVTPRAYQMHVGVTFELRLRRVRMPVSDFRRL